MTVNSEIYHGISICDGVEMALERGIGKVFNRLPLDVITAINREASAVNALGRWDDSGTQVPTKGS